MCATFYEPRTFVLRDLRGNIVSHSDPVPWDALAPHLPARARQALTNRRTANARRRLEAGATWRCPAGHPLPDDFADTPAFTVALIGPPLASKTTYLGRLVSEIVDHASLAPLGIHCTLADQYSQAYYNAAMARLLEQGKAPDATPKLPDGQTTRPIIVRFDTPRGRYNLLFFDPSGEGQQETVDLAQDNPFLHVVDAAIVFVTPRALSLPPGYPLTGLEARGPRQTTQVIANLEKVLADHPRYRGRHARRDLPIALVLAKCDELRPLLKGRDFPSLTLEPSLPQALPEKLDSQGDLPFEVLVTHGGRGIVGSVFNLTDVRTVHAVSAMGCAPDPDGVFRNGRPINVVEPLLALLYGLRIIGDRHDD